MTQAEGSPAPDPHAQVLGLVPHVVKAAESAQREDLVARVNDLAKQLEESTTEVVVLGEFKHGKSSLVNAVVGGTVCRVDDDIATAIPTRVRYAETAVAAVVEGTDETQRSREVDLPEAVALGSGSREGVLRAEIGYPSPMLKGGLVLLDTPGTGGMPSSSAYAALRSVMQADAVLFVSDASQPYSASQVQLIRTARQICSLTVCVVTKSDIYQHAARVVSENAAILESAGLGAPVILTSTGLWTRFQSTQSAADANLSGLPALAKVLGSELPAHVRHRHAVAAAGELQNVVEQLRQPLAAAQQALADPSARQQLEASLQAAKERAEGLRSQTSRWQTVLMDGVADLTTEPDHALRVRTRKMIAEAEAAIDESDPVAMWDEFSQWLAERTSHELSETFFEFTGAGERLAEQVATIFAHESSQVLTLTEVSTLMAELVEPTLPDAALQSTGISSAISLVRNTFSSMSMAGSMGSMMGLLATSSGLNPITMGVGLLLGGRTLAEERKKRIEGHRGQAKAAVRKYVEEVSFAVGKEMRDAARDLNRVLRDTYTTRAEEMFRSASAAITESQAAIAAHQKGSQEEAARIKSQLDLLQRLSHALAPFLPQGAAQ